MAAVTRRRSRTRPLPGHRRRAVPAGGRPRARWRSADRRMRRASPRRGTRTWRACPGRAARLRPPWTSSPAAAGWPGKAGRRLRTSSRRGARGSSPRPPGSAAGCGRGRAPRPRACAATRSSGGCSSPRPGCRARRSAAARPLSRPAQPPSPLIMTAMRSCVGPGAAGTSTSGRASDCPADDEGGSRRTAARLR